MSKIKSQKRQKEMKRLEKRRAKEEKRAQKKLANRSAGDTVVELPFDDAPIAETSVE